MGLQWNQDQKIFQQKNDMVCPLSLLAVVISLVSSAPLDNREDIVDIIQSQNNLDNSIDVDERPNKQVEIDIQSLDSVPLGSQFAVEVFFPERRKLETGHRIPLHLFPVETQNKILEVVEEEETPTTTTTEYVDSSSFRESQPQPEVEVGHRSAVDIALRNLFSPALETDKTYEDTLSVFAPPSFF